MSAASHSVLQSVVDMKRSGLKDLSCPYTDLEYCGQCVTGRSEGCSGLMQPRGTDTRRQRSMSSPGLLWNSSHLSDPFIRHCPNHIKTDAAVPSAASTSAVATDDAYLPATAGDISGAAAPAAERRCNHRKGRAVNDGAFTSATWCWEQGEPESPVLCRSWPGDEDSLRTSATSLGVSAGQPTSRTTALPHYWTPAPNITDGEENTTCMRGGDDDNLTRSLQQQNPEGSAVVVDRSGSGAAGVADDNNDGEDKQQQWLFWRLLLSLLVSLVCYITAFMSLLPIQSQYVFRRIARDAFNLTNVTMDQTPCAEGQNDSWQQSLNWVQGQTSQQLLYFNMCTFIPAFFVVLLVGSYADFFGRRFLVVMPMVGGVLESGVVAAVIWAELDLRWVYLANVTSGLLGSFYVLQVGLFAALADVSASSRKRVLLFSSMEISLAVAGVASQMGMGYLIGAMGFKVPIAVVCVLFLVGCLCVLLFMPETLKTRPRNTKLSPLVHLKKVFSFYIWDGPPRKRALFVMGQVVLFLDSMVFLGHMTVETLFEMNSPFCWDSVQIGLFMGGRVMVQNFFAVLMLKILPKWVRIEFIGMLGLMSGAASFILFSMATTNLLIYLSIPVGLLLSTVGPVARTLMSRMVPAHNQGALFASLSAVQTLCNLSASSLYNMVYMATVAVYPGTVFILMACMLALDCLLLM